MNPVRMKVSSSNFMPSRQCLHWAGDVVVGVKLVLLIAMMGAMSPQKPGMLWSLRSSLSASGLGRKNASSSIFMPSSEGNISAKAGDVVVGMKRTMKVWSMGLFAGIRRCGVFAW